MPGRLVDVHSHHYPDSYLDAVRRAGSGFDHYIRDDGRLVVLQDGAVALAIPQPLPTMDERVAKMDGAGVDIQLLVACHVRARRKSLTETQPAMRKAVSCPARASVTLCGTPASAIEVTEKPWKVSPVGSPVATGRSTRSTKLRRRTRPCGPGQSSL